MGAKKMSMRGDKEKTNFLFFIFLSSCAMWEDLEWCRRWRCLRSNYRPQWGRGSGRSDRWPSAIWTLNTESPTWATFSPDGPKVCIKDFFFPSFFWVPSIQEWPHFLPSFVEDGKKRAQAILMVAKERGHVCSQKAFLSLFSLSLLLPLSLSLSLSLHLQERRKWNLRLQNFLTTN